MNDKVKADPQEHGRQAPVGRAGLKLEAAIAAFQLADAIRGASAVDVGASTGGFTEALLAHGAAHVLAVDAGHGQLHERLRSDPRVHCLEGADWKRLSLSVAAAAGPFDFFTVDVSFVAARNMLRGLAFRLRAGATGVVLIKPQFELPDHLLRRGGVHDPGLRRLAVGKLTAKATALGFEVRQLLDSPVPGGEGTIEILAELVFHGRTDRLPASPTDAPSQVGSGDLPPNVATRERATPKRSAPDRSPRATAERLSATEVHRFFAVTAPGTEEIAATEVRGILPALDDVRAVPGGVEWRGTLPSAFAANLHLRVPTRILLRLGEVRAREFGKLRHQLARLPWERFVAKAAPVRVSASATRSRLYHTGAIEEALLAAVGDRFGTGAAARAARAMEPGEPRDDGHGASDADGGAQRILIRGLDDVWTVSVDTSGERLHRRGWRADGGKAPLRESLAAALLYFAGWHPGLPLVDPMCGAGTLPIEAATLALGLAPGRNRPFAFERWPGLAGAPRERWDALRRASLESSTGLDPMVPMEPIVPMVPIAPIAPIAPILASDQDAAAVQTTRQNAVRAGVADHLRIELLPLAEVEPPAPASVAGVLVANPPYGERMGDRRDLPRLYRAIGGLLRARFVGWTATIVVADARLASAFRLPVEASQPLTHGGLRVTLLRFGPIR